MSNRIYYSEKTLPYSHHTVEIDETAAENIREEPEFEISTRQFNGDEVFKPRLCVGVVQQQTVS